MNPPEIQGMFILSQIKCSKFGIRLALFLCGIRWENNILPNEVRMVFLFVCYFNQLYFRVVCYILIETETDSVGQRCNNLSIKKYNDWLHTHQLHYNPKLITDIFFKISFVTFRIFWSTNLF